MNSGDLMMIFLGSSLSSSTKMGILMGVAIRGISHFANWTIEYCPFRSMIFAYDVSEC